MEMELPYDGSRYSDITMLDMNKTDQFKYMT